MEEIHCKGNYVQECDMKDCHETICDWCSHRVLHELCNDAGVEVMRDKLIKPKPGTQFAQVCWDCADELNKLGILTAHRAMGEEITYPENRDKMGQSGLQAKMERDENDGKKE